MSAGLSELQRSVLRILCDTFVPSIKVSDDPTGFWARAASELGVDEVLGKDLIERVPPPLRDGFLALLDNLAAQGFIEASQDRRERILKDISSSSPEAAGGMLFYEKQTLLLTYGLPMQPEPNPTVVTYGAPKGQNPNWEVLGYPGPISIPEAKPKQIKTITPEGDNMTLDADVCIVGSGAGGGVIAAKLAMQGHRVVVLEMGNQYNSSDFHQLEIWSYQNLWYRGGATLTANGTVNLLSGSTLGGGTEINWMNCIRTPDLIRADWVKRFGLEGVDSPQYDRYMDTVEERLSVGSETAYFNAHNLRMREGCQRLSYQTSQTRINWDPNRFNPLMAGYTGLGDQSGAKQTVRRTFLLDAYRHGAKIMVHCRADRILVEQGCAAGVEAAYSDPQGRTAKVTIRAPQVVVACGSLESPALLLRTGIGGPAVGKYLRVQPGGAVYGVYEEKQRGWWGSPMTANCTEFVDTGDGYGFYMEIPAFAPGFYASVIPWSSGKVHKEIMTKVPYIATFIWFLRDKGHGEVTIDKSGNAVHTYQLSDETDQKNFRHATATAMRIHEAAGAREILFAMSNRLISWKRNQSENLEAFIERISKEPLLDGAQPIISAHQLCTCRMGNDPQTSVADTTGELRDVKGVWIGDASACPTSLGANPMITIMALASRTGDRIAQRLGGRIAMPNTPPPSYHSVEAMPRMPTANVFEMIPQLATNMFREMFGLITNPMNMFTLGNRILSGLSAGGQRCERCGMTGQPGAGSYCMSCGHSMVR
jgi:choline dehydrogenase-like flavoprotein